MSTDLVPGSRSVRSGVGKRAGPEMRAALRQTKLVGSAARTLCWNLAGDDGPGSAPGGDTQGTHSQSEKAGAPAPCSFAPFAPAPAPEGQAPRPFLLASCRHLSGVGSAGLQPWAHAWKTPRSQDRNLTSKMMAALQCADLVSTQFDVAQWKRVGLIVLLQNTRMCCD